VSKSGRDSNIPKEGKPGKARKKERKGSSKKPIINGIRLIRDQEKLPKKKRGRGLSKKKERRKTCERQH